MDMKDKLKHEISERFKEEIVNVNGVNYISLDVFISSMTESMLYESLLGAILHKNGYFNLNDEDVLMYISQDYSNTKIEYKNNKLFLKK